MNPMIKKSLLASSVALAIGAPAAHASLVTNYFGPYTFSTDRANFTMLTGGGKLVGGTNDVNMVWDGNAYNASSDYTGPGSSANVTASSTTPFFSYKWTAHDIQVFVPGSYSFNTALGGGAPETTNINVTVPTGEIGMHMLFDWSSSKNIDVFVVAKPGSIFGAGVGQTHTGAPCVATTTKNCLWTGPGYANGNPANAPTGAHVWMLASVDGDGNGVMGIPMPTGGPFQGFNANFNADMTATPKAVPIPAAVWLFGSGLLGLVGIARRKKKA